MSRRRKSRWWLYLLIVVIIILAAGAFVAFGPPGLYARSESPEFCGSCHAVEPEYTDWRHSAHYRAKCVDCHLPNDCLARHLVWKSLDGAKDFFAFHLGYVPDTIRISSRGATVVVENCRRCHTEVMARVNEDRQCWFCHRRLSHRSTGAVETWTP